MAVRPTLSLLGATGAVGEEILRVLEESGLPLGELRVFASDASEGLEIEFGGELLAVERVVPERVLGTTERPVDLVLSAAPGALEPLLAEARALGGALVDCTGALELDPAVPLHRPGEPLPDGSGRWLAVPRGPAAGIALALQPLRAVARPTYLSIVTLESASGAGRRGVGELSEQTIELLNSMTGELGEGEVFPQPLAFDVLPRIGALLDEGESTEERRLLLVLRRLLGAPDLAGDVTRIRVPVFGGSLACLHVHLQEPLRVAEARGIWEKAVGVRLLAAEELPSPRAAIGRDEIDIGRVRCFDDAAGPRLCFALALDELRRGAALGMVEAAQRLLGP